MTVTVKWADERKIALWWTYAEQFTTEDYFTAAEHALALIQQPNGHYYAVVDMAQVKHYPTGIFDMLESMEEQAPASYRGTIFVGVNAVTRTMLLALQKAATQGRRYTLMRSVEEAFETVERELSAGRGRY